MNITGLFIRRPAATALIMLAILAFGILAYRDLAISDLPNVDFPTIQVSASLSGASPETMALAVATPLEKQFTTIAGLDSMTSTSALGTTEITLQFDLSRNIDSAIPILHLQDDKVFVVWRVDRRGLALAIGAVKSVFHGLWRDTQSRSFFAVHNYIGLGILDLQIGAASGSTEASLEVAEPPR